MADRGTRVTQLRIYRLQPGAMDRFVAAWRGSLVPLRRKFGFEIDGAWVDLERNRFVWLVSYDGADGFEARDAAYYDSSDRAALDPDPADLIVESEHLFVETVSLD